MELFNHMYDPHNDNQYIYSVTTVSNVTYVTEWMNK